MGRRPRISIRRVARGLGRAPRELTGTLMDALSAGTGWLPGAGRGRRKLGRRRRSIGGSPFMYGASKRGKR